MSHSSAVSVCPTCMHGVQPRRSPGKCSTKPSPPNLASGGIPTTFTSRRCAASWRYRHASHLWRPRSERRLCTASAAPTPHCGTSPQTCSTTPAPLTTSAPWPSRCEPQCFPHSLEISKRGPENSPGYSAFLYLYGNHCASHYCGRASVLVAASRSIVNEVRCPHPRLCCMFSSSVVPLREFRGKRNYTYFRSLRIYEVRMRSPTLLSSWSLNRRGVRCLRACEQPLHASMHHLASVAVHYHACSP